MDIKNLILSDDALKGIDEGAWVGDLPGGGDLRFKVTGLTLNKEAQKAIRQRLEALQKEQRNVEPDDDQKAAVVRQVLGELVLQDWDGLEDGNKPVKFDRKQAIAWLISRNGDQFAALVLEAARRVDAGEAEFKEVVEKN